MNTSDKTSTATYFDQLSDKEQSLWNSEPVFKPVSEWSEEIGNALFFALDVGEPPYVTSPLSCDYDAKYFTHFMLLPIELTLVQNYRAACIKSGMETKVGSLASGT